MSSEQHANGHSAVAAARGAVYRSGEPQPQAPTSPAVAPPQYPAAPPAAGNAIGGFVSPLAQPSYPPISAPLPTSAPQAMSAPLNLPPVSTSPAVSGVPGYAPQNFVAPGNLPGSAPPLPPGMSTMGAGAQSAIPASPLAQQMLLYGMDPAAALAVEAEPKGKKGKKGKKKKADPATLGTLAARGSLGQRLDATAGALAEPVPDFDVDEGTVVPSTKRDKKKKRKKKNSLFPTGPFAGGRWQRFLFLSLVLLALSVLVIAGAQRIVGRALYDPPKLPAGSSYPVSAVQGRAAHYLYAYFSWDADEPDKRKAALQPFFGADQVDTARIGWDGAGKQQVANVINADVSVQDDHRALLRFVVMLDSRESFCADVSVYTKTREGPVSILQNPTIVECGAVASVSVPEHGGGKDQDNEAKSKIGKRLETFFEAYGANDNSVLSDQLTSESNVARGLGIDAKLANVQTVEVFKTKTDTKREVYAKVQWQLPSGGSVSSWYRLVVTLVDGQWKVERLDTNVPDPQVAPEEGGIADPDEEPRTSRDSDDSGNGSDGENSEGATPDE